MKLARNPILLALTEAGIRPHCKRVYTTRRKNGSYLVKFYDTTDSTNAWDLRYIRDMLTHRNWLVHYVSTVENAQGCISVTIVASYNA